jgi:hypothetical protein
LNGIDGRDGKDARNLDYKRIIKDVIAYLKKLPENEKLDISHLKNSQQLVGALGKLGRINFDDQRWHGGGGIQFETPTGTVNSVNTTFTVKEIPKYIIIDGITYFEDNGYTRSSLTLTTNVPPTGFIRSGY